MPYTMKKVKGGYQVMSPHGVHAKHTTKANAIAQMRLLRGVEHGWEPTKGGFGNKAQEPDADDMHKAMHK